MRLLSRAGWTLCAAFFAILLSSIVHVDRVGLMPVLLVAVVVAAILRPAVALMAVAAGAPLASFIGSLYWNAHVAWAEALVCAALTGLAIDAVRATGRRTPAAVSAPAVLFGAVVIASLATSLGVLAMRLGPAFTRTFATWLSHDYFVNPHGFLALPAAMLLLEGVLLFGHAARLGSHTPLLRPLAAATVTGGALAGSLNLWQLGQKAAAQEGAFWTAVVDLARTFRWNVHYADMNAAGSYFAMVVVLALALAWLGTGGRRFVWLACAMVIGTALWLTSSRMAVLAVPAAAGVAFLLPHLSGRRRQVMRVAAAAGAAVGLLALVAIALPQRGLQKSWFLAADVRVGLLQTGARMIASRPVFGIGLGEFYQRSGEFSSPELIAKFPVVAIHENAHNNFMQIAAELGLAGGFLFVWILGATLFFLARRAAVREGLPRRSGPAAKEGDRLLPPTLAALGAFLLTCLGGHPLLVPEPAFVFWTLLGTAAGVTADAEPMGRTRRWLVAVCILAIALTLPWRIREATQDADFEHVGIGVSSNWELSPDGIRYRAAEGHATLFVPTGAFKLSVYPIADRPLRLELKLGGRIADVASLAPRTWNDVTFPARTEPSGARYATLELRVIDADQTPLWITKVQPIR